MNTARATPPTPATKRLTPMQFHVLEPNPDSPGKVTARVQQRVSTLPARKVAQPEPGIDSKTTLVESSLQQGLKKSVEQQHPTTSTEKVV
jgi:hypothetical protein